MRRGDVRVGSQKAKFLKNCANVRGARTGSAAWSLCLGRRPYVRVERGIAEGRQAHVLGYPGNVGCAPVYGWFTEGFDTRDLKEAKALLEELAA